MPNCPVPQARRYPFFGPRIVEARSAYTRVTNIIEGTLPAHSPRECLMKGTSITLYTFLLG